MEVTDGYINIYKLGSGGSTAETHELQRTVAGFFGGSTADDWVETTVDDAVRALDEAGVGKAVITVSQAQSDIWGAPFGMDEALKAVELVPERFKIAFYVTDLSNPTALSRRVRGLAERDEIAMVSIVPSMLGMDITDRRWYPLYAVCEEAQIPVRINVGIFGPRISSRPQDPMMLEDLMIDLPDLTVIGCHMGHPWERLMVRLMMKFDRLYLMTSAYLAKYFDEDIVKFMGSSRGIGRVQWASDFPMIAPAKSLASARELAISDAAMEEFLGASLRRVLDWK